MLTPRHFAKRISRPAMLCSAALILALVLWAGTAPLSAQDRHLLWSVPTDQGRVTLMGSVHTLRSDTYPLPDPHEEAYKDATCLVFETDMARMNDPGTQAQLLALGLYPEGETLAGSLSPGVYSALAGALEERGLPPAQFSRFKPWFCALTLAMLELQRLGYSPQYGLDVHFFNRARRDGKELLHLESVEDHFQLLTSFEEDRAGGELSPSVPSGAGGPGVHGLPNDRGLAQRRRGRARRDHAHGVRRVSGSSGEAHHGAKPELASGHRRPHPGREKRSGDRGRRAPGRLRGPDSLARGSGGMSWSSINPFPNWKLHRKNTAEKIAVDRCGCFICGVGWRQTCAFGGPIQKP